MIVQINIPDETKEKIRRDSALAQRFAQELGGALLTGAKVGAGAVVQKLNSGELAVQARHGRLGLAGSVEAWMDDWPNFIAAIGVRGGSPAAKYATMLERGGVIRPVKGKALAIPISDLAKDYDSPLAMENVKLTLIPRKGRPPLLVEILSSLGGRRAQWRLHWVLLPSVTIPAKRWLSGGVEASAGEITAAAADRMNVYLQKW